MDAPPPPPGTDSPQRPLGEHLAFSPCVGSSPSTRASCVFYGDKGSCVGNFLGIILASQPHNVGIISSIPTVR